MLLKRHRYEPIRKFLTSKFIVFLAAMFTDTVGSVDAMSDVAQAGSDNEDAQVRVQLYGVNGDLLAAVDVDNDASIGQIIARCRSGVRIRK